MQFALVKKAWQQGYEEAAFMFSYSLEEKEEMLAVLSSSPFCAVRGQGGRGMRLPRTGRHSHCN